MLAGSVHQLWGYMVPHMLRITVSSEPGRTLLKLEGRLIGPWVDELYDCWRSLARGDRQSKTIDVTSVTSFSEAGIEMLVRLHAEGARLIGTGPFTTSVVESITSINLH